MYSSQILFAISYTHGLPSRPDLFVGFLTFIVTFIPDRLVSISVHIIVPYRRIPGIRTSPQHVAVSAAGRHDGACTMRRGQPWRPRRLRCRRRFDNEPRHIISTRSLSLNPRRFETTHHTDNDADGLVTLICQLIGSLTILSVSFALFAALRDAAQTHRRSKAYGLS